MPKEILAVVVLVDIAVCLPQLFSMFLEDIAVHRVLDARIHNCLVGEWLVVKAGNWKQALPA